MRSSHRGDMTWEPDTMATDFTKKEAAEFLKAEELEKHSAAMRYFHDKLSEARPLCILHRSRHRFSV